jgi:hypothetical protein
LVPSYKTAWCHDPEDHNMYVGESVLDSTITPSEILVNRIQSLRFWPKTSKYQVLSCKIMDEVLRYGFPNIGDST